MITAIGLIVFIVAADAVEETRHGITVWNYNRDDPICDARPPKDVPDEKPCGPSTEPQGAPKPPPEKCCKEGSYCKKTGTDKTSYLCVKGNPKNWDPPVYPKGYKKPSAWVNVSKNGRLVKAAWVNVNKGMPHSKTKVISAFHRVPQSSTE